MMDIEQEPMPSANAAPLLEVGFDGAQCLQAEQWAQDYAKTYTRTKLERLAIRIGQRGWEEEAEVMRAAARDTDQALTLLAMLHGRVCHMMAHLGMVGEIDTRNATVEKLGDALDDVNEFVDRVLKPDSVTMTITPQSMRQAVVQSERMLGVDLCGNCPTEDACYLRGRCAHELREAALQYRATPLQTPTGKPSGYWHVESELGHPVCDVRDEKTARIFADALNRHGSTGGVAAPPAPYRPGEK